MERCSPLHFFRAMSYSPSWDVQWVDGKQTGRGHSVGVVRGKMEVIKRKLHLGVRAYVRFLHAG